MLGFLIFLIVGGVAGWLAAQIVEGRGLGVLGNIVVGWIGAGLMNLIFGTGIALSSPTFMTFILAVLGAVILLFVVNLLFNRPRA